MPRTRNPLFPALAAGLALGVATASATAADGAAVYEEHCAGCHGGGIGNFFSGAPTTGDRDEWRALLDKGTAALVDSTLGGIGRMKPRGGCTSCSDDAIRSAVEYMVAQSR